MQNRRLLRCSDRAEQLGRTSSTPLRPRCRARAPCPAFTARRAHAHEASPAPLLPFPHFPLVPLLSVLSPQGRAAMAVADASPPLHASPRQAEQLRSSAGSPSPSSPKQSSRGVVNRRRRPLLPELRPRTPRTFPSPSSLLRLRRLLLRAQGEPTVLLDLLSLLHSP